MYPYQITSNQIKIIYYHNLGKRHVIYIQKLYIIICFPKRHTVELQQCLFYQFTSLTIICMRLDSSSSVAPLTFIKLINVEIEGCMNWRLQKSRDA